MILSSRCSDYLVLLQYSPRGDSRRSPSAILSGENRHGENRDKWSAARQIASSDAMSDATCAPNEYEGRCVRCTSLAGKGTGIG